MHRQDSTSADSLHRPSPDSTVSPGGSRTTAAERGSSTQAQPAQESDRQTQLAQVSDRRAQPAQISDRQAQLAQVSDAPDSTAQAQSTQVLHRQTQPAQMPSAPGIAAWPTQVSDRQTQPAQASPTQAQPATFSGAQALTQPAQVGDRQAQPAHVSDRQPHPAQVSDRAPQPAQVSDLWSQSSQLSDVQHLVSSSVRDAVVHNHLQPQALAATQVPFAPEACIHHADVLGNQLQPEANSASNCVRHHPKQQPMCLLPDSHHSRHSSTIVEQGGLAADSSPAVWTPAADHTVYDDQQCCSGSCLFDAHAREDGSSLPAALLPDKLQDSKLQGRFAWGAIYPVLGYTHSCAHTLQQSAALSVWLLVLSSGTTIGSQVSRHICSDN